MITGLSPEGPLCEPDQFTFVGRYPVPVRYALTAGELAQMIVTEGWIEGAADVDLTVIPCRGWSRDMAYEETGLPFAAPSPNIPSVDVAFAYPGTCFFEGTNVSEGRGTDTPFLIIGAPFIDAQEWASALTGAQLDGVTFEPITFTPEPNAGSSRPKLMGEECHGVRLVITDRATFKPVEAGLWMLYTLADFYPQDFAFRGEGGHFDRLWGTEGVRLVLESIMAGAPAVLEASAPSTPENPQPAEWQGQSSHFGQTTPPPALPTAPAQTEGTSVDPFAAPSQFFDPAALPENEAPDAAQPTAAPAAMDLLLQWQAANDSFWNRAQPYLLYE
jgi:hypothetical protein